MRRLVAACAAAAAFLVAGPITLGPAAQVVIAHAQLLTTSPGAGEVVTEAPTEIRLVFSERLDPRFSSADLLNQAGQLVVDHAGAPDPADATILVVPLPVLAKGAYTVNWRSLSAADGHQATGFISFGVGAVDPSAVDAGSGGGTGDLHGGHDTTLTFLELQARWVADVGFLLAFGLLVIALAVLRGVFGLVPAVGSIQAWSLLAAAVGTLTLAALSGSAPGIDPAGYLLGTRPGQIAVARVVIGVTGAVLVWILGWRGRHLPAQIAGGVAGGAGLVLVAIGGHASAFPSPAPAIAIVVHLGAVGTWLAGLGTLGVLLATQPDHAWVRPLVPRFSAVALVSIGLVGATGLYAAWLETGSLFAVNSPYEANVCIKAGLVVAALVIGAMNFVSGGERATASTEVGAPPVRPRNARRKRGAKGAAERRGRPSWFAIRIALEGVLAAAILVASANLASGSPPGPEDPTELAPAAASSTVGVELSLLPARPGPNRLLAAWDGTGAAVSTAEVRLDRLDTTTGEAVIKLPAEEGASGVFAVSGLVLPPGSRWDTTVILRDPGGGEVGRRRFAFSFGADGLVAGEARAVVDPGVLIALLLALAGLLSAGFAVAGGSPPRVDRAVGRGALLAGAAIALPLALAIVVWRAVP
jgi:copper transport protein